MKKLPKEKRNKVVLVWLLTLMVAAGWVFGVLSPQLAAKRQANDNADKLSGQFSSMTNTLAHAQEIEDKMNAASEKLSGLESNMASGDVFSWAVSTIRKFKQNYDVDIPQLSQVTKSDNNLLPKFPYQQASLTMAGTAYYADLGRFIADFENQFHFARVINLDLQPASAFKGAGGDAEKLNFKMDVIFLVKPDSH